MVRYMVAVDGSNNAKAAFYTALFMMNKKTDELIILHVVERIKGYPTFVPHHTLKAWQNDTNLTGKAVLTSFARLARAQGVKYTSILGVSNHVGEMICQEVESKQVDLLVVGRRGLSGIKKYLVGSTSRYVTENAKCNVLVVKGDWGPEEIHGDREEVIRLEEEERQRRMEMYKDVAKSSDSDSDEQHELVDKDF